MLGVGGPPTDECADPDLINAGKQPVTELTGVFVFCKRGVVCHDPRRTYGYEHPWGDAGG